MAGYNGYSMSNNAVAAYEDGEKPLSKWTKKVLFEEIEYINEEVYKLIIESKLTAKEIKDEFLFNSSWHHTSMHYNETNFYKLDEEKINSFTQKELELIISCRKPKIKKTKEEKEEAKRVKELKLQKKLEKQAKKEFEEKIYKLMKYQKKYKTLTGLLNFVEKNPDYIKKLEEVRKEKINIRREELRNSWVKQNYLRGLNAIDNDEFIDDYVWGI